MWRGVRTGSGTRCRAWAARSAQARRRSPDGRADLVLRGPRSYLSRTARRGEPDGALRGTGPRGAVGGGRAAVAGRVVHRGRRPVDGRGRLLLGRLLRGPRAARPLLRGRTRRQSRPPPRPGPGPPRRARPGPRLRTGPQRAAPGGRGVPGRRRGPVAGRRRLGPRPRPRGRGRDPLPPRRRLRPRRGRAGRPVRPHPRLGLFPPAPAPPPGQLPRPARPAPRPGRPPGPQLLRRGSGGLRHLCLRRRAVPPSRTPARRSRLHRRRPAPGLRRAGGDRAVPDGRGAGRLPHFGVPFLWNALFRRPGG